MRFIKLAAIWKAYVSKANADPLKEAQNLKPWEIVVKCSNKSYLQNNTISKIKMGLHLNSQRIPSTHNVCGQLLEMNLLS